MMFLHCVKCIEEKPADISIADYSRYDVAIDKEGLLIGCRRHEIPIVYLTPASLMALLSQGIECEMCKQGIPHEH